MSRRHPDRYTIRSASPVIAFWVGAVVLFLVVGAVVIRSDWRALAFVVPPALLLTWILWIVLYRPAVHYDATRVVVVNIGRQHLLPWSRVTAVRQGIGMIFELDSRKPLMAWGAPAQRPRGLLASALDRRTRPSHDLHEEADLLDGARRAAPSSSEPVVSSWDVVPLVIGAVLTVAVVIEFLVGV